MRTNKILLMIIILFSFISVSYNPPSNRVKNDFKPCENFKWLMEVKMLHETLSIDHFEKTPGRGFDSAGIYMDKGKYHPVNLFQYGIICFDIYRSTNNDEYKKKCLNQFKYFLDSTKYTIKEDGSIGFPYNITFRDLKPLWYSGLAQSEAIMYLIRYYYLTKDRRALDYIQRIKTFMLVPQESGGTFRKISEDVVWIEEYPNSKSKPEVINGFVTAIMALREYTMLFPDDKEMKQLLKQCLYSHKKEFYKYDLGNGIYYDMGEKQIVGPWYSKWQVIQMKQMFELFGDTFYKNIEMLWASYAFNKSVPGMTGCLLVDTNFSSPGIYKDGWISPRIQATPIILPNTIKDIFTCETSIASTLKKMFDNNENTSYTFLKNDSVIDKPYLIMTLTQAITANVMNFITAADTLNTSSVHLFVKEIKNSNWTDCKLKLLSTAGKEFSFTFNQLTFDQIKVVFDLLPGQTKFNVSEFNFSSNAGGRLTTLTHFTSPNYNLNTGKTFNMEIKDADDYVLFYKTANNVQGIDKAKWDVYYGIRKPVFEMSSKDSLARFLLIFKNKSGDSKIKINQKS